MTTADSTAASWSRHITALQRAWAPIVENERDAQLAGVRDWRVRAELMRHEQGQLAAAGAWATGPPTLMAALWAQHNEVMLTRALAWLLNPHGRHRLGSAVLDAFADHLGLEHLAAGADVQVVTEETRQLPGEVAPTRADLLVYTPVWTLVVEAKVFAPEQPEQLDRLHILWATEVSPCWVFLTRDHRPPLTSRTSAGSWQGMSWAQAATLVRTATERRAPGAGVLDFVETLEAYHSG